MKLIVGSLIVASIAIHPTSISLSSERQISSSWSLMPQQTSADLAKSGLVFVNSAVIGDPENQYLVTFWESDDLTYRCVDRVLKGPVFVETGCSIPK